MKLNLILNAAVTSLLLTTAVSIWAVPPRQHAVTGVIEELDRSRRQLILKSVPRLELVWNERTRFLGHCPDCQLKAGQMVKIYYRRELGQNVLREVSLKAGVCQQGQP